MNDLLNLSGTLTIFNRFIILTTGRARNTRKITLNSYTFGHRVRTKRFLYGDVISNRNGITRANGLLEVLTLLRPFNSMQTMIRVGLRLIIIISRALRLVSLLIIVTTRVVYRLTRNQVLTGLLNRFLAIINAMHPCNIVNRLVIRTILNNLIGRITSNYNTADKGITGTIRRQISSTQGVIFRYRRVSFPEV